MLSLSFKLSKNKGVNWAWHGHSPVQNRGILLGAAERSLARGLAWYCVSAAASWRSSGELWFSTKAARGAVSESA